MAAGIAVAIALGVALTGSSVGPSFSFTIATPTVPACTAAADGSLGGSCAFLCTVNAGTAWQCVDGTGSSIAVTQGVGTTFVGAFGAGIQALNDVTDATGPTTAAAAMNIFNGDLTIVVGGYTSTQTSVHPHYLWSGDAIGVQNGIYMRNDGSTFACQWFEGGLAPASTVIGSAMDGWGVSSCRRSGNQRIARVNGLDGTADNTVTAKAVAANMRTDFGWSSVGVGNPARGPVAFVVGYTVSKTAAQLEAIEANFWGMNPVGLGVYDGIPQLGGLDNTAISGQVDMYAVGAWPVSAAYGIHTQRNFTNSWAANPLDVSTWTAIGTPTNALNVAAGPFSRWHNTAEADRIVDADVGTLDGYGAVGNEFTVNGNYTMSCFIRSGDTGVTTTKAQLQLVTDGTGSATCNISTLTSTFARYSCTAVVGGAATSVRGRVLVGNAAADTGSILVSQCQQNSGAYAETPTVNNAPMGNGTGQLSTASYQSFTSGGKIEMVFTPQFDPNASWQTPLFDTQYVLDVYRSPVDHSVVHVFGYTAAGTVLASWRDLIGGQLNLLTTSVSLVPYQTYVTSLEWRPHGSGCDDTWRLDACATPSTCHAVTIRNSDTTGTAACPSQPTNTYIGNRFDGSVPTSQFVYSLKVYR